jgi:hypothetical protein
MEPILPGFSRDVVVLHATHAGSGGALIEMLDELFDRIGRALSFALDLERSDCMFGENRRTYGAIGCIGDEACHTEAFGLLGRE